MKYSVFEQAAIEAGAGLEEVDAEIEQLVARRQVLESKKELLDTLVHQLMLVLPAGHREYSAEPLDDTAALPDTPAARLFPVIPGGQDSELKDEKKDEKLKDEWYAFVQRSTAIAVEPK